MPDQSRKTASEVASNPTGQDCATSTVNPSRSVNISAVTNGWLVSVDANFSCGVRGEPYVYTKPEEVAGAVYGLITRGLPGFATQGNLSFGDLDKVYNEGFAAGKQSIPASALTVAQETKLREQLATALRDRDYIAGDRERELKRGEALRESLQLNETSRNTILARETKTQLDRDTLLVENRGLRQSLQKNVDEINNLKHVVQIMQQKIDEATQKFTHANLACDTNRAAYVQAYKEREEFRAKSNSLRILLETCQAGFAKAVQECDKLRADLGDLPTRFGHQRETIMANFAEVEKLKTAVAAIGQERAELRIIVREQQDKLELASAKGNDYHTGFEDGKVKVTAELTKKHREEVGKWQACVNEQSALNNALRTQRDATQVKLNRALRSPFQQAQDQHDADMLSLLAANSLADRNAVMRGIQDKHDAARMAVHAMNLSADIASVETENPASVEFMVGDVWTFPNGLFRTITRIDGNYIEYTHSQYGPRRRTMDSFRTVTSRTRSVLKRAPVVPVPCVFTPARLPGEPACGFAVGDVWTSQNGDTRTITKVSAERVTYVRNYESRTGERRNFECSLGRNPDKQYRPFDQRIGPGAIVARQGEAVKVGDVWTSPHETRTVRAIENGEVQYIHTSLGNQRDSVKGFLTTVLKSNSRLISRA